MTSPCGLSPNVVTYHHEVARELFGEVSQGKLLGLSIGGGPHISYTPLPKSAKLVKVKKTIEAGETAIF